MAQLLDAAALPVGGAINWRNTTVSIDQQRKDHARSCLSEADLDPDPIRQFALWFDEANQSGTPNPTR